MPISFPSLCPLPPVGSNSVRPGLLGARHCAMIGVFGSVEGGSDACCRYVGSDGVWRFASFHVGRAPGILLSPPEQKKDRAMPLRRARTVEPMVDLDLLSVRFPMVDAKSPASQIVWGEVTDFALRERAAADGVTTGLEKAALFERYRLTLEGLASELFDEGRQFNDASGMVVVRVVNL